MTAQEIRSLQTALAESDLKFSKAYEKAAGYILQRSREAVKLPEGSPEKIKASEEIRKTEELLDSIKRAGESKKKKNNSRGC